jgi:hypothetical protein
MNVYVYIYIYVWVYIYIGIYRYVHAFKHKSGTLRYASVNKQHKSVNKQHKSGTLRYASVNKHEGFEQSRRDDLEELVYVIVRNYSLYPTL